MNWLLMIGVRLSSRGHRLALSAMLRCAAIAVLAGGAWLGSGVPKLEAQDGPPRARGASRAIIDRNIRQTANPLNTPEEEGPVPEGGNLRNPRRRERLTGPDPEIENIKEPLADVIIEGNKTIPADDIAKKIKTRPGRPPDANLIKEDVRSLYRTKWFFNVETRLTHNDEGPVLVFRVLERPMLQKVTYEGNKKIKTKELAEFTGLKEGGAYDPGANKEAARRIENYYHEKSFVYAEVKLKKGEDPDDREVIFDITEGPKVHVDKIQFKGNKEISAGVLKTQVKTKTRILWLIGGKYDPSTIPEDIGSLKQYYHSLGYFDVKIKNRVGVSDDKARITLEYEIEEGVRYKVRNVEFVGNRVIKEEQLRTDMKVLPNEYFNERFLTQDKNRITAQYGELGRIFAKIEPSPRWIEEPGIVDLVYNIDEDRPYKIGRIHVHIEGEHPHTKESVVLTRLRIKPGDLASREKLNKSEQALRNTQIFAGAVPGSPGPHIVVNPTEPLKKLDEFGLVRGQDDEVIRAQNQGYGFDASPNSPHFGEPPPSTTDPSQLFEEQPPGFIEPHVYVQETQTGRLMFGVGVNSNAGLVGSVVLEENNFDILRPPTSTQDVLDGTAWRGGGQQFRIEAVPGNQLSRYLISWRDPYFMDQNVSLGTSGFYYQRYFPNWFEQRMGGRINVGRQFTPELSGTLALRLEDVRISDPSLPVPPELNSVLGSNFLSTVRASVAHDTRDSTFIPGKGHYIEAAYEQGVADFVYPRVDFDARQYFTLKERPDGGNRHIVSLAGQLGWTGDDTPIFEKYFAGGFQSFRGFAFYGVTPRVNGVRVGGFFQALGSFEYMLPVTADDTIALVGFTDMGTVEEDVTLDQFRLSVGAGIRLTIPAMGPVPIALDFGIPILKQDFDNRQVFAFYVGMMR